MIETGDVDVVLATRSRTEARLVANLDIGLVSGLNSQLFTLA